MLFENASQKKQSPKVIEQQMDFKLTQGLDENNTSIKQNKTQQKNNQFEPEIDQILIKASSYKQIDSYDDFVNFMDNQIKEIKSQSKYYFKIIFQIFVYMSSILELIFTLMYGKINNIQEYEIYAELYYISLFITILIHIYVLKKTQEYMNAQRNHLSQNLLNYCFSAVLGILSYSKLLPFLMFYTRKSSIQQFSFSQFNKSVKWGFGLGQKKIGGGGKIKDKYLILKKIRNKPVNIFRDLIFYRTGMVSMLITILTQSIPMLFIQGIFNTQVGKWNAFNIFNYCLLINNILYCLTEHQLIALQKKYIHKIFELKFVLSIKFDQVQKTKQIIKADEFFHENVQNIFMAINSSKLNEYERSRQMNYFIKYILRFRTLNLILIQHIDSYQQSSLQYLANALKFIEINQIIFGYTNSNNLVELQNTFNGIKNFQLIQCDIYGTQCFKIWKSTKEERKCKMRRKTLQENSKRTLNQFYQINGNRNRQISKFFYQIIPNQMRQSVKQSNSLNEQLSQGSLKYIENLQKICSQKEDLEQIKQLNEKTIQDINKIELLKEQLGFLRILADFYKHYERIKEQFKEKWGNLQLNEFYLITLLLMNITFQTMKLIYFIQEDKDELIWALIILEIIHPILMFLPFKFAIFEMAQQMEQMPFLASCCFIICYFIFFYIFCFFKLIHFSIFFFRQNQVYTDQDKNIRFKNYTAKFEGNIGMFVFSIQEDSEKKKNYASNSLFYQLIKWILTYNDVLSRIPQIFLYILTANKNYSWGFSFVSTSIDGLFAMVAFLDVFVIDYFVPTLLLRKVSVDQFFQSELVLNQIEQSIILDHPKSFAILSKLDMNELNKRKYKIDFTKLDYSQFDPKKKQKLFSQLKLALVRINSSIEIDKAQEFFYFGEELNQIFKCLQVSELQQLKLNFQLDQIPQENLWLLNIILSYCPYIQLEKLEILVETKKLIQLKFDVERKNTLTCFCYSYYQMKERMRQNIVQNIEIIKINKLFLQLDRYDFKQFNLDVAGFMDLTECQQFFNQFTEVKIFGIKLQCESVDQIFNLYNNILSSQLTQLSIQFENIYLNTLGFSLDRLEVFELTLINCKFDKQDLQRLFLTMKNNGRIILDQRSQNNEDFRFTNEEILFIQQQLQKESVRTNFYCNKRY